MGELDALIFYNFFSSQSMLKCLCQKFVIHLHFYIDNAGRVCLSHVKDATLTSKGAELGFHYQLVDRKLAPLSAQFDPRLRTHSLAKLSREDLLPSMLVMLARLSVDLLFSIALLVSVAVDSVDALLPELSPMAGLTLSKNFTMD